jgi:anaerobic selenocysteine-containing dehydrogenase
VARPLPRLDDHLAGALRLHVRRALLERVNDRGATVVPATVTDRIAPGVVSIREGAWFRPDERGDHRKGCANVLTDDRSAPSGATTYNTCLVQVEPAPEHT